MWGRAGDFNAQEWQDFISTMLWGITFALIFALPIKRVRRWNVLAVGLTAISAILAYLLVTAALSMLWQELRPPAWRPVFRYAGSLVNLVIIVFLLRHAKEDDL